MLHSRHVGATVLFLSAGACHDRIGPDSRPDAAKLAAGVASPVDVVQMAREAGSTDEFFARVHDLVSGFAGLILEHGVPTVYLVDTERSALAEDVLTPFLVARGNGGRGFQVRQAQFSWAELYDWRLKARALLHLEELRSLGISVSRNRLLIGLAPGAAPDGVLERLPDLEVAAEAVEFKDAEHVPQLATLSDRLRPLTGGIQIDPGSDPAGECTAGFNVQWGSSRTMLTAAHCVYEMGSVMFPVHTWQPEYSATNNRIGVELVDPSFFTCTPEGETDPSTRCRYSDAALIQYDDSVAWSFGHIARTMWRGQWNGSKAINPDQARLWITDFYPFALQGDTLDKIGWRTGWTTGLVTDETCVDRSAIESGNGRRYWLICQTAVKAGAGPGDSGSPVFYMDGYGRVILHGVLWGGWPDSLFFFSSMQGIELDFGAYIDVITDAPTLPSGVAISGPTEIQPDATCFWEGSTTGGTTPLSYRWTNDGLEVSTTDSYVGGKDPGSMGSSFVLTFTVTNDAGSSSTQITVTENANAPMCLM